MDFGQLYHFLFETFEGIGCLIAIGLVISIIACIIMERRTRKRFVSREADEDDWSFFDDDDDEEDRKCGVQGQRGLVGVDLGGRRVPVFNLATIRTAHPPHRTIAR